MSLLAQIKTNLDAARRAKDSRLLTLLTTLYSEAGRAGLNDGKRDSTDEEVIKTVKKFNDGANDLIKAAPSSEAAKVAAWEISVLAEYLPKQLSEEQIVEEVQKLKDSGIALSIGRIMGHFSKNFTGQYDGTAVSKVAKGFVTGGK